MKTDPRRGETATKPGVFPSTSFVLEEPSILVIDPRRRDREKLLRRLNGLFAEGARFLSAASVEEAAGILGREAVDCILVSQRTKDSVAALGSLAHGKEGIPIPVVLVVEDVTDSVATRALDAGAFDLVSSAEGDGPGLYRATRNAIEAVRMRRILEEQRQVLASGAAGSGHDPVTELPERIQFCQQLSRALSRDGAAGTTGVLLIGLDEFKAINSSFGHGMGDELLRVVAGRLRHCVRNVDTIARWGGDEFAALLQEMSRPEDAVFVAKRILYALSRPFVHKGQDIYVTASVGIAFVPEAGEDVEALLQHADAAMYRVKGLGGNNYQVYSPQMNVSLTDRLETANRLRRALKQEEFILFYQPQLDVHSGRVVGLEALLRWKDSAEGLRSPAEFIPILEETGLIVPVGDWVLRKACTQARAWQYAGLSDLRVAVNLSPKQFRQQDLSKRVATILRETGLEPGSLELELTETVLMDDQQRSSKILSELKDMGSLIALDDFGTGYSSLGFLKAFPVDTLKIDRTFIRDIGADEEDRAICSAIVSLGQALKLHVMAEGVETEEQMEILRGQGCHLIQGFLFAKPMPPDDVWDWLTEKSEVRP